jgi:hypothetical protein
MPHQRLYSKIDFYRKNQFNFIDSLIDIMFLATKEYIETACGSLALFLKTYYNTPAEDGAEGPVEVEVVHLHTRITFRVLDSIIQTKDPTGSWIEVCRV